MTSAELNLPDGASLCRSEDVSNLYNLLLRRDVESEAAIESRMQHTIQQTFRGMVGSAEFSARVARNVAERGFGASAYLGRGRIDDLLAWAIERLPIETATRERLAEAATWADVDHALLTDRAIMAATQAMQEPEIRLAVERRCAAKDSGLDVDTVYVAPSWAFVSGSVDAAVDTPIQSISLGRPTQTQGSTQSVARRQRQGEDASGIDGTLSGFWSVVPLDRPIKSGARLEVTVSADRPRSCLAPTVVPLTDAKLRDVALEHLAGPTSRGDPVAEALFQLDNGVAETLIDLNRGLTDKIVGGAGRMCFGGRRAAYDGSIVVCLRGKSESLMLQAALFSQAPGFDRYEFIYVVSNPELSERLANDAAIASLTYGVAITLIVLPGETSLGAAGNLGAAAAESDRLLFVGPGVLPRDADWAHRHAQMVESLPAEQTAIFGATLFYDDGSLMHGGMYFEIEDHHAIRDGRIVRREVLNVEHYGRGAPPETGPYRAARPVPAVNGAFLSVERGWFERLGGFSAEFGFSYGQDADLCFRSLEAGAPVWLHDLPFWHFELQTPTPGPADEGARLISRWLLTSKWGELVKSELNGRQPVRFGG
jgi:hypothetical protein